MSDTDDVLDVSSVRIELDAGPHAHVRVWARRGLAGVLVVGVRDAELLASRLLDRAGDVEADEQASEGGAELARADRDLVETALHEASHAVANLRLAPGRLTSVTIERGAWGLGLTRCRRGATYTDEVWARLVLVDLAGPAVEELITGARPLDVHGYIATGELPAGASSDLKNAVRRLELSSVPDAARRARMLRGEYEAALKFLHDHEAEVRILSVELLERRTMDAAECEAVIRTANASGISRRNEPSSDGFKRAVSTRMRIPGNSTEVFHGHLGKDREKPDTGNSRDDEPAREGTG